MWTIAILLLCLTLAVALYVRLVPSDPDVWHIDPAEAADPGERGIRLVGQEAPRFPGHSSDVLSTLAEIVTSTPGSRRLDGDVGEGMMTFVTRSKFMRYPDYFSVKATDEGTKTKLSILARSRFGWSDLDVNRNRLQRWLGELDQALR